MASCLVPDFPAVMVALEHLKELDKQLKEERVPFLPEASINLREITAAITELEADRRASHEHLEVETIENSKLRQKINKIRERMRQEIVAGVAAARASNAEEIEKLHKDLKSVSQLQEVTVKRDEVLLSQNKALHPELEQVKAWHEEIIAAQNDQITLKYGLQMQLDRTRDWIEDLKSCIAAVEQDKITLQQKTVLERESFSVRKDKLSKEVDQVDEKIKEQKQVVRRSRIESDGLNDRKQETHNHLGELMMDLAKLESNLRRLEASRCQNEKQLQGLKEEISTVEGTMEKGRESRLRYQNSLAQIFEIFKCQREEENEVRAEHFHVSQQLERSKLQLEERIASVVRHGKEIKEMDKQIRELLETDTITKRVFERNQEELCDNVDTEKKNIEHYEEEKRLTMRLMHDTKTKQEEHVAKMTSDISDTRRRYRELRQEEAALHKRHPKSTNADLLMSHMTQREVEFRHKETKCHEEIEQCLMEVATITISHEEKQRELEEKEDVSNDVAAKWNEEQSRHQRLKTLTSELRRKRSELELTIQSLKEEAGSLLQPKEEMKAELEAMRKSYMDVLGTQASEMRAVEISVYDNSVKLEQVSTENSRLHLAIQQMTEDVTRAREDKERYWQEVQQFERNTKTLFEILQDAWRVDLQTTQDCQTGDGVLLESISGVLNHLKTRRQQLGTISTHLHCVMLDFSKRLGDKSTVEQQS
ncbi:Coiled-coil domain containing protein 175 [Dissostichus eleginoides]|uniref:Coiled-coil domain containing protein 175 n=1 Tax=Dissostichus eleginoides TaxID=100907 RepID=A0AAD9BKA3_DISEL|nr:Coiled-coil domain containing protein 175 [Dissostichus eleginoides]